MRVSEPGAAAGATALKAGLLDRGVYTETLAATTSTCHAAQHYCPCTDVCATTANASRNRDAAIQPDKGGSKPVWPPWQSAVC